MLKTDATKANVSRIFDYFLGGSNNFEVDRLIAERIKKASPNVPEMIRLIRSFFINSVKSLIEMGFDQFIDFTSGLLEHIHIHSIAPSGTKIIYSDPDPLTVKYSKEMLGNNPDVKYEQCNIESPETLLNSNTVKNLFAGNHKTAIGFTGACYFMSNDEIKHTMQTLYNWADKGSIMFLTDFDRPNNRSGMTSIKFYKNMNQFLNGCRSKEELIELIKPWKLKRPGFIPLHEKNNNFVYKKFNFGNLFGGFLKK